MRLWVGDDTPDSVREDISLTGYVPWMGVAWEEHDLWWERGWNVDDPEGFLRAWEYIDVTGEFFSPKRAGWCGCFVDWVLKRTNRRWGTGFSTVVDNPSGSQNYASVETYPGGREIEARKRPPYGMIAVLRTAPHQGHVGFVVDARTKDGRVCLRLLSGNQVRKVCVQEFELFEDEGEVKCRTRRGTVFTLVGYRYPREYDLRAEEPRAYVYPPEEYPVEERVGEP